MQHHFFKALVSVGLRWFFSSGPPCSLCILWGRRRRRRRRYSHCSRRCAGFAWRSGLSSSEYSSKCRKREEKGEDGEGQVEVEDERGELKERRTCTWMTRDETQNLSQRGACDPTSKCDEDHALSVHAQVLCILRVFMFVSLYLLLMWFVSCLSSVLLHFFLL